MRVPRALGIFIIVDDLISHPDNSYTSVFAGRASGSRLKCQRVPPPTVLQKSVNSLTLMWCNKLIKTLAKGGPAGASTLH